MEVSALRTDADRVAVIAKMVDVLDALASGEPANPTDLARKLQLPRTTVYRILQTLVDKEVLTSCYEPGPRLIRWVSQAEEKFSLQALSRPSLGRLVQEFRETVSVYVRVGASRLCIVRQEGLESVHHSVQVGVPMSLHVGSAGRVLLAWLMPDDRQALIVESVKSTQIPEPNPLPDWTKIQAQGWAMTVGERDPLLASISVPIFNDEEEVLAALSISGPRQRFTLECVDGMVHSLQEEARLIQKILKGSLRIQ